MFYWLPDEEPCWWEHPVVRILDRPSFGVSPSWSFTFHFFCYHQAVEVVGASVCKIISNLAAFMLCRYFFAISVILLVIGSCGYLKFLNIMTYLPTQTVSPSYCALPCYRVWLTTQRLVLTCSKLSMWSLIIITIGTNNT